MKAIGSGFWWLKMIVLGLFSFFFLVLGVETLVGAFQLKNPLEFIMYFFSASFMILISIVGVLYPIFQIHAFLRHEK
ncbi:MAG: hypothetical protein LLG97_08355 [Deltaproteobacteria bacterium]|nr:hypothetical protein [Deltaproteobacteria bacterium]